MINKDAFRVVRNSILVDVRPQKNGALGGPLISLTEYRYDTGGDADMWIVDLGLFGIDPVTVYRGAHGVLDWRDAIVQAAKERRVYLS